MKSPIKEKTEKQVDKIFFCLFSGSDYFFKFELTSAVLSSYKQLCNLISFSKEQFWEHLNKRFSKHLWVFWVLPVVTKV